MSQDLRSQPWVRIFQDLTAELPGLVGDRLGLLALEQRRLGAAPRRQPLTSGSDG